jgi:di/tricarboxylate transporter
LLASHCLRGIHRNHASPSKNHTLPAQHPSNHVSPLKKGRAAHCENTHQTISCHHLDKCESSTQSWHKRLSQLLLSAAITASTTTMTVVNNIMSRFLQEDGDDDTPATWEPIFTIIVLVIMFAVLITDRVGTDSVMLTALTTFYISGIIDIEDALSGFNSQGLLTVLVLFVVAEGLNKTGALNWYVGKLFGRPTTLAGAQLRVMIPITLLSGFINDTPLVTVTLPIVMQWARKVNLSPRFVLIPLSFAALLGGVFTIIGTSTNLIIVGLLIKRYPDDPQFQNMSLFGLGQYGT